jgi:hypothetical protein
MTHERDDDGSVKSVMWRRKSFDRHGNLSFSITSFRVFDHCKFAIVRSAWEMKKSFEDFFSLEKPYLDSLLGDY